MNLRKVYKTGVAAVNGVTFGVKKNEVVGLLGPNGAGKSTLFSLMTMEFKRTEGQIRLMDTDLDRVNVSTQGNQMGMCPQFNTIWGVLSVDQCLNYVGQVKGLSKEDLHFQRELIKKTLDLESYSNTLA
jgi:ABC-type multidrug transport system ATPase subunit